QLVDGSLQRATRADRQDGRFLPLQPALDLCGTGLRDANRGGTSHRVAEYDLDLTNAEPALQRLGALKAGGNRMVQADLDETFGHGERHESLRRLPGNSHGRGNLVLCATSDIIEPAGPRRIIQPPVHVGPSRHYPFLPAAINAPMFADP